MRRFYVSPRELLEKRVFITGTQADHARRVLRLKPGDAVVLFDGRGGERRAVIERTADSIEAVVSGETAVSVESPVRVVIAQSFLKEKKMDALIRPLTELGVFGLLPFFSVHSVARPDAARLVSRKARWERIAVESARQCGRTCLPVIDDAVDFTEMLRRASGFGRRFFFFERCPLPLSAGIGEGGGGGKPDVFAVIGPEGGFSEAETRAAEAAGLSAVGLGPRILRAETAALAVCALLQHRFGDLGA